MLDTLHFRLQPIDTGESLESSPSFLVENQVAEAAPYATDEASAEKLWALSEKLVGQKIDI